jgi:glycosyltransferase involved in cell wall biosynthesis
VKNHDAIVAAWSLLTARRTDAKLLIVGDGDRREGLERFVRSAGLSRHVLFMGQRNDVRDILAASDAGILYSNSEGLGMCLLEMMSMQLPVVASDIIGINEVVTRDTGILVAPGSPAHLCAAIDHLLSAPAQMQVKGTLARQRVQMSFSRQLQAERFEALYRSLAPHQPN